jgi:hypothetical protein
MRGQKVCRIKRAKATQIGTKNTADEVEDKTKEAADKVTPT